MGQTARNLIELLGHAVALHAEFGGGLVHQVDGLVGQETFGDIALGELHGSDTGVILDTYLVVVFIAFLQTTKDRDGADFIGLINHHGLESAFQSLVLLEVFLVFIEGGGTDRTQFASCQCGFQDVGCVHGTLALAGTNERMNLVDEEDDTSVRSCHLINNALQAFLELTLVLGTCHQCTHIEREELLVLQILGHVATYDTLGQTFNDGCLTCTGLANQDGVVLCAAR